MAKKIENGQVIKVNGLNCMFFEVACSRGGSGNR